MRILLATYRQQGIQFPNLDKALHISGKPKTNTPPKSKQHETLISVLIQIIFTIPVTL